MLTVEGREVCERCAKVLFFQSSKGKMPFLVHPGARCVITVRRVRCAPVNEIRFMEKKESHFCTKITDLIFLGRYESEQLWLV